jgi:ABC-type sugar transport system ATPase subunit
MTSATCPIKLTATDVRKVFRVKNQDTVALDNLSLEVRSGELVTIVGTSGCGKSTFLRMVAGLIDTTPAA